MTEEATYPRYRWFLLFIAWFLMTMMGYNNMMFNVQYDLLAPPPVGIGLTPHQFYLCITATTLAPVVMALASGLLTDRIGVKRVVLIGSIIAVVFGLLRILATGFVDMFIYCIVMGVGLGTLGGNAPKLVGQWFHVKQIYLGIGLILTALAVGPMLSLATGALWPSWSYGFLVVGLLLAVATVVWAIWGKDRPREYLDHGRTIVGVPMKEGLLAVIRSKNLWLIVGTYALANSLITAYVGGMPLIYVEERGVPRELAGLVCAIGGLGYAVGIPLFAWFAEKVGYIKPVLVVGVGLAGLGGYMTYLFAPNIGMWLFAVTPGFCMGAAPGLIMQMPLRFKEIGTRYAGSAVGLIGSINAGVTFIMLPFVFEPMWAAFGSNWAVPLFFVTFAAIAGLLFIFSKEVGRKYLQREFEQLAAKGEPDSS